MERWLALQLQVLSKVMRYYGVVSLEKVTAGGIIGVSGCLGWGSAGLMRTRAA